MAKQALDPAGRTPLRGKGPGWVRLSSRPGRRQGQIPCSWDMGTGVGAARHGAGGIISAALGQVTNSFIPSFMELLTVQAS